MIESTMQDHPMLISAIFEHGRRVYGDSVVTTWEAEGPRRATFAEVGDRTAQLAHALAELGVGEGTRVGTFCWNTQEHLEAYFAVPGMGAVLHTLNLRLFPEQLAYVINHAEDEVVLVDGSIIPLLARVAGELKTVKHVVVIGEGDPAPLEAISGVTLHRYEEILARRPTEYAWPVVDERSAAALCYTSGTTGNPKGVAYSHRSTYVHSLAIMAPSSFGIRDDDTILPVVPMFHANAWGLPYAGWWCGASFLMPGRFLQPEPLAAMISTEKPTMAPAVPSIWTALLPYVKANGTDIRSLRVVPCGGSAVPRSLMEAYDALGVRIIQAWGMTETSPLGAVARPPRGVAPEDEMSYRQKTGRIAFGVEMQILDDHGKPLPWDGTTVGEVVVRGPFITGRYFESDDPEKFHEGWLRTGDIATIDPKGFMQITDRAKDVIKSGGEWISSVDLENAIMGHEAVLEAAVIGVHDPKWEERPLACVVLHEGAEVTPDALRAYLEDKVAKWWLPERWAFIGEVPKTSVGKFDKKVLRAQHERGEIDVLSADG